MSGVNTSSYGQRIMLAFTITFILVVPAKVRALEPPDLYSLQSTTYLAMDRDIGSYLWNNSKQRSAFGLPLEPISAEAGHFVRFTDFEGQLLSKMLRQPVDVLADEFYPAEAAAVLTSLDLLDRERDYLENQYDLGAQTKLVSGILQAASKLSEQSRLGLWGSLVGIQIDQAVELGEVVRSRIMQNRALAQARMPLGIQRDAESVLHERVDKRSGAFRLEGRELLAQGGWQLDHHDGVQSIAYARYDFKNKFTARGAMISTLGEAPEPLPLRDAVGQKNPLDFILNWIGHNSNWIGRNVTGGESDNTEMDSWGQFTLGDTTIDGKNIYDRYARLHDIEYFVSTHFPKGTEIRVPGPRGPEYFVSEGSPSKANLRVAARVLTAAQAFLGGPKRILNTHDGHGRSQPLGNSTDVVDLMNMSAMVAKTHAVNRAEILRSKPGGMFRSVEMKKTPNGVAITTRSSSSYHVYYNGAAVSAAVDEYNRTGVYNPLKHYQQQHTLEQQPTVQAKQLNRALPVVNSQPKRLEYDRNDDDVYDITKHSLMPGSHGPPPPKLPTNDGGSGPPAVGGVSLEPHNTYTIGGTGIESLSSVISTAALLTDQKTSYIEIDGQRMVIARVSRPRQTVKSHPETEASAIIGRFGLYQTDLVVEDLHEKTRDALMLRRFFDSSDVSNGAWSWIPFELEVHGNVATLVDRQADRRTYYRRNVRGVWDTAQPVDGTGPSLHPTKPSGFEVDFANDFSIGFNDRGKLIWMGSSNVFADRVQFQHIAGRLVQISKGNLKITLQYDERGRVVSASDSMGGSVAYSYKHGLNGQLDAVSGLPVGSVSYAYDEGGRLVTATGTTGTVFTNQYDNQGRLLEHGMKGHVWRFDYANLPRDTLRMRIHDQAGETTTFFYDANRRLTAYGPAAQRMTVLRYDKQRRIVQLARATLNKGNTFTPPHFSVTKSLIPL